MGFLSSLRLTSFSISSNNKGKEILSVNFFIDTFFAAILIPMLIQRLIDQRLFVGQGRREGGIGEGKGKEGKGRE